MKAKNYIYMLIITAVVAILAILSPVGVQNKNSNPTVALVPHEGFEVLSDNPVTVEPGGTASFEIKINDGYFYRETPGFTYENGRLTVSNITESGNLYFKPGKHCRLSIADSKRGFVELIGPSTVDDGEKSSIRITCNPHYEVDSIKVGERFYPAPSSDTFAFTVEDTCVIEVNFIGEKVNFMAMSNNLGTVNILNSIEQYHYGDIINLNCEYDNSTIRFKGWSLGGYIDDGGSLLDSKENLDYTITADTILYANFKDLSTYTIAFNGNGGSVTGDINISTSPNVYVNLPVDNKSIVREGYTLTGYNSKADYTGTHYSLGAMYLVPRNNVELYAEWVKNTDTAALSYTVSGSSVTITGFKGNATNMLCIPGQIGGKAVTAIAAGAFRNCSALKTVILPVGLTTIGENAFSGCTNLQLIYLPETITSMPAGAFSGCDSLTHMRVLASLGRAFDYDYDSAMADKYMLLKNTPGKRLILVGGSSMTFGLNSVMLKEKYPDYSVINFGNSFLYGISPLFDMLEANIHEGDVVVFAPEYFAIMFANEEAISMANWQYLESNYDILEDINLKRNTCILNTYLSYLNRKRGYLPGKLTNKDSVYVRSGVNSFGDLIVYRASKGTYQPSVPGAAFPTDLGMGKYNTCFKNLTEKGARCLFSFPPMSSGGATKEYMNNLGAGFVNTLKSKIDSRYCTIISSFGDYALDKTLFYDSMYHLTLEGAKVRTAQLIADLENWGGMNK